MFDEYPPFHVMLWPNYVGVVVMCYFLFSWKWVWSLFKLPTMRYTITISQSLHYGVVAIATEPEVNWKGAIHFRRHVHRIELFFQLRPHLTCSYHYQLPSSNNHPCKKLCYVDRLLDHIGRCWIPICLLALCQSRRGTEPVHFTISDVFFFSRSGSRI